MTDTTLNNTTRLEPLSQARARQLLALMQQTSRDERPALALDDAGRVTGLVNADTANEPHLLGDLDVHA